MKKTLKRVLAALFAITMIFTVAGEGFVFNINAAAQTMKCGDNLTWTLNKPTGELVISGSGDMYDYEIGQSPFDSAWSSKVIIKSGVTSIGNNAFSNIIALKEISIPDTVKRIGKSAFEFCGLLESVSIPNAVSAIEENTFANCSGLKSVSLPDSLTSIGKNAFICCGNVKNVTIPDSVKSISEGAFASTGLTSVNIPANVTNIEKTAFCECNGLKSITVDSKNSKYDSRNNCNAIINSSTNELVAGCVNTAIPDSIKAIGAFSMCFGGVSSIIVPNGVTVIGDGAFQFCTDLKTLTIPATVTKFGDSLFPTSLKEIFFTGTREQWESIPKGNFNGILSKVKVFCSDEKAEYTVTYESRGGTVLPSDTQVVEAGGSVTLPKATHKWLSFLGWTTDYNNQNTADYSVGEKVKIDFDTTFYGIWGNKLGDVNGDTAVNSVDALMILQHTVAIINFDKTEFAAADVTGDFEVNSSDALKVLQYTVGTIKNF